MSRCSDYVEVLDVFLDGELAEAESAELAAHLDDCGGCREALERRERTRGELRQLASSCACSDAFHERLAGALTAVPAPQAAPPAPRHYAFARWVAAAAVTVGLAGVGFGVGFWLPAWSGAGGNDVVASDAYDDPDGPPPVVVDESIRWHNRHVPVEVTGPDPAAVSAWFRDKLEFPVAPPTFDRRAHLIGGRLSNVERSEAAFLLYDMGGTKVSVMVFDPARTPMPRTPELQRGGVYVRHANGYAVAVEERDGVAYSYTTRLPGEELTELVSASTR